MRELVLAASRRNANKFNEELAAQRSKLRSAFRLQTMSSCKLLKRLVPRVGVEPTRPYGQRILSPQRLPFRHPGDFVKR